MDSSSSHKFITIDVETTGKNAINDRIIQIAAIKLNSSSKKPTYDYLSITINPELKSIPIEATNIHGKTIENVKDSPTFKEIASLIIDFIGTGDITFIGHCIKFDLAFIENEFKRCGLKFLSNYDSICTYELSLKLYHNLHSYKLYNLCKHFKLPISGLTPHDALSDVILCSILFRFLLLSNKNQL